MFIAALSIIVKNRKTRMSSMRLMDEQNVVHSFNIVMFNNKKKLVIKP
jgi:hypothetical protein